MGEETAEMWWWWRGGGEESRGGGGSSGGGGGGGGGVGYEMRQRLGGEKAGCSNIPAPKLNVAPGHPARRRPYAPHNGHKGRVRTGAGII